MRSFFRFLFVVALVALGFVLDAAADNRATWSADADTSSESVAVIGSRVVAYPGDVSAGPVLLYDLADGSRVPTDWGDTVFGHVALDRAGGRVFAVAAEKTNRLHRLAAATGDSVSFDLPEGAVWGTHVDPNGTRVAVDISRRTKRLLVLLDAGTGLRRSVELDADGRVKFVSPRCLLVNDERGGVRPLDARTGTMLPSIAPGHSHTTVRAGHVVVHDHGRGTSVWSFAGDKPENRHNLPPLTRVAADPGDNVVGWIDRDAKGEPRLRLLRRGGVAEVAPCPKNAEYLVALSRDAAVAVVSTDDGDGESTVFDVRDGRMLLTTTAHIGGISADGGLVLISMLNWTDLFDVSTVRPLRSDIGGPAQFYESHLVSFEHRLPLGPLPFSCPCDWLDVPVPCSRRYAVWTSPSGGVALRVPWPELDQQRDGGVVAAGGRFALVIDRKTGAIRRYDVGAGKPWVLVVGVPVLVGGIVIGFLALREPSKRRARELPKRVNGRPTA